MLMDIIFTIKVNKDYQNFAMDKIANAISLAMVNAVLQSGMQCPGSFGRRASKKNSRIDVWQKDCINILKEPTQKRNTNFYSIYYMIGGQDNEYETINNGLNDDIDKFKDVISDNALTLKCDGDDAAPNVTIECKSILSTFEYDLTQLEYRMEYLNNETPSTFYSGCDFSHNHVKHWTQSIMGAIRLFEDTGCSKVTVIYNSCKEKANAIISVCKSHLQRLKEISDNDKKVLHCLNISQKELAAKSISYKITDKEKLQQMINGNKLYQAWIEYINKGHSKEEADLYVARTFYKNCTCGELEDFVIIKASDELVDMPMSARKLFRDDKQSFDEWKEKLNAISQVGKQRDFNKHIYRCYGELQTCLNRKHVDFIHEDIYSFIKEIYTGTKWDLPKQETITKNVNNKGKNSRSLRPVVIPNAVPSASATAS